MTWLLKLGRTPFCQECCFKMHLAPTPITNTQRILHGRRQNTPRSGWLLTCLHTHNTSTAVPFELSSPPSSHLPSLVARLYMLPPSPSLPLPSLRLHPPLLARARPSFGFPRFPLSQSYSVVCEGLSVGFEVPTCLQQVFVLSRGFNLARQKYASFRKIAIHTRLQETK